MRFRAYYSNDHTTVLAAPDWVGATLEAVSLASAEKGYLEAVELEETPPPAVQRVVIDNRLTYSWAGNPPLAVGESVRLPGNHVSGMEPWVGEVTALASDYVGPVREVLGRADS